MGGSDGLGEPGREMAGTGLKSWVAVCRAAKPLGFRLLRLREFLGGFAGGLRVAAGLKSRVAVCRAAKPLGFRLLRVREFSGGFAGGMLVAAGLKSRVAVCRAAKPLGQAPSFRGVGECGWGGLVGRKLGASPGFRLLRVRERVSACRVF
jgi:hypothetical protein